jgi:2-C-methyl-D-erythritol 4-phosphate cytidylyltransferase
MSRTAAILLAAGSGRRMEGSVADKVLATLAGRPVFSYSAGAFLASGVADFYAVVYRDQQQMLALSAFAPTPSVLVRGGKERQDSVENALEALPDDVAYVFIHDSARPLVQPDQLTALHKLVRRTDAAVLAHRVVDTIKEEGFRLRKLTSRRGQFSQPEPLKLRTLERSRLWAMETPQVFSRGLIARGYARARAAGRRLSDDAAAVELLGHPIALLENPRPNPKLTTPSDLAYLEFLLAREGA